MSLEQLEFLLIKRHIFLVRRKDLTYDRKQEGDFYGEEKNDGIDERYLYIF